MVTVAQGSDGAGHSEPRNIPPQIVDPRTPEQLVEAYAPLVRSMASRYRNRGVDLDDLKQVALLGLTKAARRFDPAAGHDFLSYAVPTVRGELRRHFRDCGWMVRPPRRVQELQGRIGAAEERLSASLGRSPRPTEIAAELDEPLDEVVEALAADGCFTPASLDAPVGEGGAGLGDIFGGEDREFGRAEAAAVVVPLLRGLAARDRRIVQMRFFEERTQEEIAQAVGLTQAQVSRTLARLLRQFRSQLGSDTAA